MSAKRKMVAWVRCRLLASEAPNKKSDSGPALLSWTTVTEGLELTYQQPTGYQAWSLTKWTQALCSCPSFRHLQLFTSSLPPSLPSLTPSQLLAAGRDNCHVLLSNGKVSSSRGDISVACGMCAWDASQLRGAPLWEGERSMARTRAFCQAARYPLTPVLALEPLSISEFFKWTLLEFEMHEGKRIPCLLGKIGNLFCI